MDVPPPPGYEEFQKKLDQIIRMGSRLGMVVNIIEKVPTYVIVHFNKESLREFIKNLISHSSSVSTDIMEKNRMLVYNAFADAIKNSEYYKVGKEINLTLGGLIYVKRNSEILFPKTENVIEDLQKRVTRSYNNANDFWYDISKYLLMVMIVKSAEWHKKMEKNDNISYAMLLVYHEGNIVRSKLRKINELSIKMIEES